MTAVLRRHWLATALLAAGLVLRVLAQIAYRPALFYIDTIKYLYNAWPSADPVGYKAPLKLILQFGDLGTVTAVQHVLGLAMAAAVYLLLYRRGVPRALAALAIAPVLLDAYQLQIEQTIMPDVWFEALIIAGLAVLLWRPVVTLPAAFTAGLILGTSATVRQVGEILILPALIYLIAASTAGAVTWRQVLTKATALCAAFALPVLAYSTGSYALTGHFWLSSANATSTTYGRMAAAADCATLRLPADERPLCPTSAQQALGPDWLDHDAASPLKTYVTPPGLHRDKLISDFSHRVLSQQPLAVLAAIGRDAAEVFTARTDRPGATPISRWQFQTSYPAYPPAVGVTSSDAIVFGLKLKSWGGPLVSRPLDPSLGGRARVFRPAAAFLRSYQLGGGYTPGPLLAIAVLAGLAGSLAVARRRASSAQRQLTLACLLFFSTAAAVLLTSDSFQFSWRYQLPALITLPPAGALGIAAIARSVTCRMRERRAAGPRDRAPELAAAG